MREYDDYFDVNKTDPSEWARESWEANHDPDDDDDPDDGGDE